MGERREALHDARGHLEVARRPNAVPGARYLLRRRSATCTVYKRARSS